MLLRMPKMTKAVSWCCIIDLILNLKLHYLYEYLMTLWNFNIFDYRWIQNITTFDLWFNIEKK
jgi:hypothetical protein